MSDNVIEDAQEKIRKQLEAAYKQNCANASAEAREVRNCQDTIDKYKKKKDKHEKFKERLGELIAATKQIGTATANSSLMLDGAFTSHDASKYKRNLRDVATKGCSGVSGPAKNAQSFCGAKIAEYNVKILKEKMKANRHIDSYNVYARAANTYKWTYPEKSHI